MQNLTGQPTAIPNPQMPTMVHMDRPEVSETFADSCFQISVEGFNVKLEFVVNRMNDPKPGVPPSGKATTAERLVLPIPGILDLHAKLTQLIGALQAHGVLKQVHMPPMPAGKPN